MKNKKLFAILTLVCFMFTLMPVAAFAAGELDPETSYFEAVDGDQTVKLNKVNGIADVVGEDTSKEYVEFTFDMFASDETAATASTDKTLYVWAVNEAGNASSALKVVGLTAANGENVWKFASAGNAHTATTAKLQFVREGEYTVYAGVGADNAKLEDITPFSCKFSTITVKAASEDPDKYKAEVIYAGQSIDSDAVLAGSVFSNTTGSGTTATTKEVVLEVVPNNVATDKVAVYFYGEDGKDTSLYLLFCHALLHRMADRAVKR